MRSQWLQGEDLTTRLLRPALFLLSLNYIDTDSFISSLSNISGNKELALFISVLEVTPLLAVLSFLLVLYCFQKSFYCFPACLRLKYVFFNFTLEFL